MGICPGSLLTSLSLNLESVKEHRPLLERIAAGEPVTVSTDALEEMGALLGYLEAEEDSRLRKAVLQVKGYLANARRRAKFAGRLRQLIARKMAGPGVAGPVGVTDD